MSLETLCYIDDAGFHFSDFPTVLDYYKGRYRSIYGDDVYLEDDSQDGEWITEIAQSAHDCMSIAASVYNSFNPGTAQGDALARNVKINGIRKAVATASSVDVLIGGADGTEIINGIVSDTLNQRWLLPASVTIPPAGEITVTATAATVGAVTAAIGTVTQITTPVRGWQTVTNLTAAAEGAPIESDAALRRRQAVSTALPALTVAEATQGALEGLTGVTKIRFYENDSNTTDADTIPAHSIAVVIKGGDAQEIGDTIAKRKTPGTGTYGTTAVTAIDRVGNSNVINFYRPTGVRIIVEIELEALSGYSVSTAALIKAAVALYVNAAAFGKNVIYSKLYTPANLGSLPQGATYNITSLLIAVYGDTPATSDIDIDFNEEATLDVADITVTPL